VWSMMNSMALSVMSTEKWYPSSGSSCYLRTFLALLELSRLEGIRQVAGKDRLLLCREPAADFGH